MQPNIVHKRPFKKWQMQGANQILSRNAHEVRETQNLVCNAADATFSTVSWIKQGLLIKPGKYPWIKTHIQNPFSEHLHGDVYRIHFAGRDSKNRAQGGYIDINIQVPFKILSESKKPTLTFGKTGCFDDCGAMPSCIVSHQGKKYMYYTGWTKQILTPFSFFIGLAVASTNKKTFKRYSLAPILGRNIYDPYLTASPWVIKENEIWKMWYVSGMGWDEPSKHQRHYYTIKYAISSDGVNWETRKDLCIDFNKKNDEYAIARPIVYKKNGLYKMWYCYRGGSNTYRAGYAESKDGISWDRKDNQVGIAPSKSGWDKDMICYPYVFQHKKKYYMLYNGNGYGKTGCGLAIGNKNSAF